MRKRLSKVSVTAVTLLLMLLTCEGATRLFARIPRDVSQRDPLIGRRFQPNLSENIYNHEAKAAVFFQTNQFGFRGSNVSAVKPPGVRRVAVLGDSYTAAEALPEDQTFCSQLQTFLRKTQSSVTWEVLNFGIPGAGTGQELALYRHLVRDLDVDIVVIAFGNATDVRDNSRELGTNPIVYFEVNNNGELVQIPLSKDRITLSNWLNRTSRFYYWQKSRVASLKQRISRKTKVARGRHLIYARQESTNYTRAWNLTSEILKVFQKECREDGAELMVAAMPSAFQIYPDHFEELTSLCDDSTELDPTHPDQRLGAICNDLEIPFISLTAPFREQAPSGSFRVESEQLFFGGTNHFNVKGSRLVASELSSWISQTVVALGSSKWH